MTMTYAQFENFALDLKRHSDSIDDDWHIYEHQSSMVKFCIEYAYLLFIFFYLFIVNLQSYKNNSKNCFIFCYTFPHKLRHMLIKKKDEKRYNELTNVVFSNHYKRFKPFLMFI